MEHFVLSTCEPLESGMLDTVNLFLRRVHRVTHRMPFQLGRIERAARVLVIAPHRVDEAAAVGGCLALHRRLGSDVTTVFVASERPDADGIVGRQQGAERAADLLGFKCRFLHMPDGEVALHERCVAYWLAEVLRTTHPEVVFCPFPGDHYRDHGAVAASADRALLQVGFGGQIWCYESWSSLWPNCGIDISDVVDVKRAAIACYEAQPGATYAEAVLGLNRYRGLRLGVAYAEGLFVCRPSRFHALCAGLSIA